MVVRFANVTERLDTAMERGENQRMYLRDSRDWLVSVVVVSVVAVHLVAASAAVGAEAWPPAGGLGRPAAPAKAPPVVKPAGKPVAIPTVAPPDGKWLTDETGRQYYVAEVPRVEGGYLWENDAHTRVRLRNGLSWDVVSSDEKTFRIKIYQPASPLPRPTATPLSRQEKERIDADFRGAAGVGKEAKLQPLSDGLPTRGQWRNGFDVADMNRDGHLDIVHGPPRKGGQTPVIFLGDGKGHWKRWSEARFPSLPLDYGDVAAGDLDGNGIPDLVVASHLRGIVALIGDGQGNFRPWTEGIEFQVPGAPAPAWSPGPAAVGGSPAPANSPGSAGQPPPAFTSREIALIDWDGDGRLDIVALAEGPTLARQGNDARGVQQGARGMAIYRNKGDGSWERLPSPPSRNFGSSLALADLDRDGRTDVVTGSDVRAYRDLLAAHQADGSWKDSPIEALRANALHRAVASADFDRDGKADLAVSFFARKETDKKDYTGIDVLLARDGGFERRTIAATPGMVGIGRLAAGDLDGDGNPDLVGVDGKGGFGIFRGDGKGGFTRVPVGPPRAGESCQGYGLAIADLDGDGRGEVLAGFADEATTADPTRLESGCASGGALQVWKVELGPGGAAAGKGSAKKTMTEPTPEAR